MNHNEKQEEKRPLQGEFVVKQGYGFAKPDVLYRVNPNKFGNKFMDAEQAAIAEAYYQISGNAKIDVSHFNRTRNIMIGAIVIFLLGYGAYVASKNKDKIFSKFIK